FFLLTPSLSSFSFYLSRHHLDLHSFPTRRSSDLSSFQSGRRESNRQSPWSCPETAIDEYAACPSNALGIKHIGASMKRTLVVGLDRKSTRLNSSHVAISYAVFCLKKKIKKHKKKR